MSREPGSRLPGLSGLKARPKEQPQAAQEVADRVGNRHGFHDRSPRRKKPGRKKSPRSWPLHPRVMPAIGEAFVAEAERLGLTQGQLMEDCWKAYLQTRGKA
ncbi:MAG: chromosome partitioning protein ParB [Rhodobacteraceae bacterium]|nr:chromosome partitioning protein ParB [Paracoccaceae bacterium]MCY4141443.1 chromosome partitioning protein ParB [Paracoccaceae bacterium]